ncbi:response regulator [Granulosicoccus sp. 3-233]|uniref:response regulator n=1 Tax=Granulosicoccus sp. 3-233 TaxID=3417969 RepID=UPI003D32A22F
MHRDRETREVNGALQRALFDEAVPSVCLGLIMVLVSATMLHGKVSANHLILWGSAVVLVSALRLALVTWVRSRRSRQMPIHLYTGIMVVSGALWGTVILLWSAELTLVDQLVIALLPVLAALGGLLSLGHWPPTYLGFIGAMLVAMIFSMEALADDGFARLLVPLALIATGCLYCSYRLYLQKREMLLLRLRNQMALRSKDEFLARMSHELRTPMNGVLGMVRMLGKTPLNHEQQSLVATLNRSGNDMLELVSDLLDAASLASQDVRLSLEPCDPCALTRGVVDELQTALSSKGLTLNLGFDPGMPASMALDPARWSQICRKLLDNAVNFTEQGRIDVQLKYIDGYLVLMVRDTGCGIDASELEAVRKVFHQVRSDVRRRVGGIGIGLPIAQALVDLMNGTLVIDSQPGKGTCVTVSMPVTATTLPSLPDETRIIEARSMNTVETPEASLDAVGMGGQGQPRSQMLPVRVLVAEDNPVNQLVIEASLDDLGCDITLVENGLEALTALQSEVFDIVFMDCQMPELDGFEATRRARAAGFELPIVAVTANAVAGDRERCLAAGMNDYVSKPFADDDLKSMLDKWLDERSLETPVADAA